MSHSLSTVSPHFHFVFFLGRERNREHAKKCRSRKKNYLKSLEDSVIDLKRQNERLLSLVRMKFTREELANLMKAGNSKMPEPVPLSAATDYLNSLREGSSV